MTSIQATIAKPQYCRREAWDYFVKQLPKLNTTEGLLRAAIGVSLHALDDLDPAIPERRLRMLSECVVERSPSRHVSALQANLHGVLFDEDGFLGNLENYYNALNSYLPAVLNTRRGLPVSLALIYKVVGEWSGLSVEGINAPGHFLTRVWDGATWMIVDPFFRGQLLTEEQAFQRIEKVVGRTWPRDEVFLAPATHSQWIARLLGNLRQLFANENRHDDLAAMTELALALDTYYPA